MHNGVMLLSQLRVSPVSLTSLHSSSCNFDGFVQLSLISRLLQVTLEVVLQTSHSHTRMDACKLYTQEAEDQVKLPTNEVHAIHIKN